MAETEVVPESRISALIRDEKKGKGDRGDRIKSILALSAEHVRLELIRRLGEGDATLQRPTSMQNEIEALYSAASQLGVNLPAVNYYITRNRELSPGAGGKGIDSYLKVLTPVPTFAMPGAASEEEKGPGLISKVIAFVLGTKSEEKK